MERFLKEVARGKRGARDLILDEAREAARLIVDGNATPAQIGSFLVAERIKTESEEEILAFAEALREKARRLADFGHEGKAGPGTGIDCAGPYNGRRNTFFASWPAAFVLAEAGLAVTLHGVREIGPKRGVTLHKMLLVRGIDPDEAPLERLSRAFAETGVGYAPAERLCPPLKNLHDIREQLGVRTVLNTAEKLVDYGCSPFLAMGIFHRTVAERYARVASRLGYERTAVVQGMEGSEDLYIDRPTWTWLAEGDRITAQAIDPERYGLKRDVPGVEWTAGRQMEMAEAVLAGTAPEAYIDMTLLNVAFRLQLAGRVPSMEDGLEWSRSLLFSGKPRERCEAWLSLLAGA